MFTGLVQQVGQLKQLKRSGKGWSLTIQHNPWPEALVPGESVAVQGACLTMTSLNPGVFTADLLDETLQRTALKTLGANAPVNLERALAFGDRLGGHLVSGHVDECGRLFAITAQGRDAAWRIACSTDLTRQTVIKGSITVDGVSLTVTGIGDDWVEVKLIPHTLQNTSLCHRQIDDQLNIEGDLLGKYVARMLDQRPQQREITTTMLAENGFI